MIRLAALNALLLIIAALPCLGESRFPTNHEAYYLNPDLRFYGGKFSSKRRARKAKAVQGTIETKNSGARSGSFFLPKNYRPGKKIPLLIAFHGSSISGANMVRSYRKIAQRKKFAVLAPDSSNPLGWNVPDDKSDPTEDMLHFYAVFNEFAVKTGINIERDNILISGTSAGAAMAAFIGTNDSQFSKIAILHGGVIFEGLGLNAAPFWVSTGSFDELRPPALQASYISGLTARGFKDIHYSEYPSGHKVIYREQEELVNWWLGNK